jgi:hypothetical protein
MVQADLETQHVTSISGLKITSLRIFREMVISRMRIEVPVHLALFANGNEQVYTGQNRIYVSCQRDDT